MKRRAEDPIDQRVRKAQRYDRTEHAQGERAFQRVDHRGGAAGGSDPSQEAIESNIRNNNGHGPGFVARLVQQNARQRQMKKAEQSDGYPKRDQK